MKIRIFVLRKFVKRTEKIIFSLVFVCFPFTKISYFRNFPSNENVRKQHLFVNAYSCINMKFSHKIAVRKDEIVYVVLLRKQAMFHLRIGQLFVDDIYAKIWNLLRRIGTKTSHWSTLVEDVHIFLLIFCRKRDRRVMDLFFLLHGSKC